MPECDLFEMLRGINQGHAKSVTIFTARRPPPHTPNPCRNMSSNKATVAGLHFAPGRPSQFFSLPPITVPNLNPAHAQFIGRSSSNPSRRRVR